MTLVVNKPAIKGIPIVAFGVSVSASNKELHKEFMYFLSYIKFERLLEDQIMQFARGLELLKTIEEVA
jgi:hypothetical protein